MFGIVHTVDAPKGAIITEAQLRAHLEANKPLWEGVCGRIRQITYGADWVIKPRRLMPKHLFLYLKNAGADTDYDCVVALRDRHIGTEGYNDNWWFEDETSALAYQINRIPNLTKL